MKKVCTLRLWDVISRILVCVLQLFTLLWKLCKWSPRQKGRIDCFLSWFTVCTQVVHQHRRGYPISRFEPSKLSVNCWQVSPQLTIQWLWILLVMHSRLAIESEYHPDDVLFILYSSVVRCHLSYNFKGNPTGFDIAWEEMIDPCQNVCPWLWKATKCYSHFWSSLYS